MAQFFEAKIKYDRLNENGEVRKVIESYLLDSLTCTECEERVVEKVTPHISGEYEVTSVKKSPIAEIFTDESDYADKWYLVKVNFIALDEKSGKEKKSMTQILVQAGDLKNALDRFQDGMKGTLSDYHLISVAETPIMDVFPYEI